MFYMLGKYSCCCLLKGETIQVAYLNRKCSIIVYYMCIIFNYIRSSKQLKRQIGFKRILKVFSLILPAVSHFKTFIQNKSLRVYKLSYKTFLIKIILFCILRKLTLVNMPRDNFYLEKMFSNSKSKHFLFRNTERISK